MTSKRLKNNDILELIGRAMIAGPTESKKIYDQIILSTSFVVDRYCAKYKNQPAYQDLQQTGLAALCAAVYSFNPNKCPQFYGWICPWVRKSISTAAYQLKKYFNVNCFDSEDLIIGTVGPNNQLEYVLSKNRIAIINKSILATGLIASKILIGAYGLGANSPRSFTKIADSLNISRYKVEMLHNKTIKHLFADQALREMI